MEPKRSPTAVPERRRTLHTADAHRIPVSATILPLRAASSPEPVALDVDEGGRVLDCSPSVVRVFGYRDAELRGRHVSVLLPRLEQTPLMLDGAVNARLAFLCHCGALFRGSGHDGAAFACEMSLNRLGNAGSSAVRIIVRRVEQPVPHCL